MATKKSAAASTRKPAKKPATTKKASTKVTTVKAVSAPAAATRPARSARFKFSRAPLLTASVAEFIGTFMLAAVVLAASGQPLFVMFAVIGIVLTIGGVSGAHLNPALTVGALATRRIGLVRALSYIAAQVLGAVMALVVLNAFISAAPEVSQQQQAFGQSSPTLFSAPELSNKSYWTVLASELLGSVILAFTFAAAMRLGRLGDLKQSFAYGAGLYVAVLVAGTAANYVGASAILNPAVAASLQALKLDVWTVAIYAIVPLIGGVIGFALSDLVQPEDDAVATVTK